MSSTQNLGSYYINVYSGNNAVDFNFTTGLSMATDAEMASLVAAIKTLPWPTGFGQVTVQAYKQQGTLTTYNYDGTTTPPSYD